MDDRPASRLPALLLVGALLPLLTGTASAARRTDITVKGSDTMVLLMKRWAQAYSPDHPDVSIQVTGGGTGTGFAALINRTTDICMASRPIRPDEIEAGIKTFQRRPLEIEVAQDALIVFVNAANPLSTIALPDLAALFAGRIRNWERLGAPPANVVLYSRENSSGTYAFFKEAVLHGGDFAPQTQTLPGTAAVLAAVARDVHGIGYGGLATAAGVRALGIQREPDGPTTFPSPANVTAERYPIARRLYVYVNPHPALHRGAVGDFVRWIQSPPAQAIVRDVGYFPLPDPDSARDIPPDTP